MTFRIALFAISLLLNLPVLALTNEAIQVEAYFNAIKSEPEKLNAFLKAMPKGGDLHNHLSGAIDAESLLDYAKDDGFCINRMNFVVFTDPACQPADLLSNALQEPSFYNMLIDAWSIRNFQPINEMSADHFFNALSKYNAIVKKHLDRVLARVVKEATLNNESYLELMIATDGNLSGRLGKELGWDEDFDKMRDNLLAHHFDEILQVSNNLINQMESSKNIILGCDLDKSQPECAMEVRYLYQIYREQSPEMVFAQMLAGFEIAKQDKRVVGLNLVQPEYGPISIRDYTLQMRMLHFLHQYYPEIPYSLHAGELNEALAAPQDLTFHIKEAVEVAKASRIGHGVDIFYEKDKEELLKTMSEKGILIEVNLSSNAFILNAKGSNHPLPLYLNTGVPVTLSTDDQGVNRSNLSNEYQLAVTAFDLDYATLKYFARNSLYYSFLPGKNLWTSNQYLEIVPECVEDSFQSELLSSSCTAFLKDNEKAALQWKLEKQFNDFEKEYSMNDLSS